MIEQDPADQEAREYEEQIDPAPGERPIPSIRFSIGWWLKVTWNTVCQSNTSRIAMPRKPSSAGMRASAVGWKAGVGEDGPSMVSASIAAALGLAGGFF